MCQGYSGEHDEHTPALTHGEAMLSGEAGVPEITQTDAGDKWREAPFRGTGGAQRFWG